MAYPTIYDVTYSYTGFQQAQGDNSFPGTQIDADFAGLNDSVSSLALFVKGVMRSDGALQNGVVTYDSLSASLQTAGLAPALPWATATFYAVGKSVIINNDMYRGLVAHTSGDFATDLAAGKWLFVASLLALPGVGSPLVILATGQSNISIMRDYTWTPPENLFLWNGYENVVGSAFDAAPQKMSVALGFASEIAKANPNRLVYVVNQGYGSQPIAQWMVGAAAPDMFASCKSNTEAALAVLGVNTIDIFFWWQGESDAIANTEVYPFNFETVMSRFQGETWFPTPAPTIIMGFSPYVIFDPYVSKFDDTLRQIAAYRPESRTFVSLSTTLGSDWEATDSYIHMNAAGYAKAGRLAYQAFASGANSGDNVFGSTRVIKRVNTQLTNTATMTDDLELKCYLRSGRTYRVRGSIRGSVGSSTGFKWALTGPASGLIEVVARTLPTNATADIIEKFSAYPTNAQITVAGNFSLEFDAFIFIVSANGVLNFQFAQIVSGAAGAFVFPASFLEIIET